VIEITSVQYTGYFSNYAIYVDEFKKKKEELRAKKILEEEMEKVQEEIETGKLISRFREEKEENKSKRNLKEKVKEVEIIIETGKLINLFA
jgi:NAD/NADP transhydrogenase alpha subunit